MISKLVRICLITSAALLITGVVQGKDWYVSATRGKGKKATKTKPAKDLGNIIKKLQPGDTVFIAKGVYLGRSKSGHDQIKVPIRIIGGWDESFSKRDPWGAYQTVFSGDNLAKNFKSRARLEIIANRSRTASAVIMVDGIIVDNGARNSYNAGNLKIKRKYSPRTGANATPDSPGIAIWGPTGAKVTVQNCIVMNTASSGRRGAIEIKGSKGSQNFINNNLVINNTSGIACLAAWHGKGPDNPKFNVQGNTVLFTWKFDPMATHGGTAFQTEPCTTTASGNVFAFNDYYGAYNRNGKDTENLTLNNNLFCANMVSHYMEWGTQISIADLEDEAEKLAEAEENVVQKVKVAVTPDWSKHYAARTVIDRQKAEADVKIKDNGANQLRRMLGLPLEGTALKVSSSVWLHRLPLADAIQVAGNPVAPGYGCTNPNQALAQPGK